MTDLSKEHCKPCEGGIPPLNKAEIEELRKSIKSDWKVTDSKIEKEYACKLQTYNGLCK